MWKVYLNIFFNQQLYLKMALHTQSTQARRSDESDKDRCAEVTQLQQKAKLKSIYSLLLSLHGFWYGPLCHYMLRSNRLWRWSNRQTVESNGSRWSVYDTNMISSLRTRHCSFTTTSRGLTWKIIIIKKPQSCAHLEKWTTPFPILTAHNHRRTITGWVWHWVVWQRERRKRTRQHPLKLLRAGGRRPTRESSRPRI